MTLMQTKKCPRCKEDKLIVEFQSAICGPCCLPDVDAELELCRYRAKIELLERALKKADVIAIRLNGKEEHFNAFTRADSEALDAYEKAKKEAEEYKVMK